MKLSKGLRICEFWEWEGYILTGLYSRRIGKGAWEHRTYALVLALGGITFFLMNWETSGRYITNFVPVMMLLALWELNVMANRNKNQSGGFVWKS